MIDKVEQYIQKYVTLAQDYHSLPLGLWAMMTHAWTKAVAEEEDGRRRVIPLFDAMPYLVINKPVKRAGGTRCMEIMSFISSVSRTYSADSPSSMFRDIEELHPSMFIDEAEKLNQENHPARELLNKGYRTGQTITRVSGGKVVEFDCFCPKAFVLIGDVYDTLRDRSIPITMRRRTPIETAAAPMFRIRDAKLEGEILRDEIAECVNIHKEAIETAYHDQALMRLEWLNDRDEEIWQCLFAICHAIFPDRIPELQRASADLAAEKQAPAQRESKKEAERADFEEAKILLLKDIVTVINGHGKAVIPSAELLEKLQEIPTAQWRRYKGRGLTGKDIATMLKSLHVRSGSIRLSKKHQAGSVQWGYKRESLLQAAKQAGLLE